MASPSDTVREGRSAPPYPHLRSGVALVCGNAWTLKEDHRTALEMFPDACVIAVNGAAHSIKADMLFSQHPLFLEAWAASQRKFHDTFEVHTAGERHRATKLGNVVPMPWVDYTWHGITAGGTSCWTARRMAAAMGFDRVVLCGAPLECGGYFGGRQMAKHWRQPATVNHYRKQIEADTAFHAGAFSMSGWTRDLLGAPA